MNTIDLEPYKIVHKIHAHNEPIRAMCNGPFNDIVTASQDRTVKRWIGVVNDDGSEVVVEQFGDIITHNHWVTSLISLKPEVLPAFPNGLIITGCMDSIIRLYDGLTSELLYTLVGHEKGIISFSFCDSHENVHSNTMRVSSSSSSSSTPSDKKIYLISGSWDGTAKVWDLSSCAPSSTAMSVVGDEAVSVAVPEEQLLMPIATLPGHENGVHACGIMVFGQPIVITTSTGESVNNKPANFQIRFWNCLTEEELSADYRIKDHAGPIRSIKCLKVRTNDTNTQTTCSFMTTSNDGTIKLRDVVMCWNHESNTIEILDCQCFGTVFHPSDGEFPPFILDCCTVQSASPSPTVNVGEENRLGNLPLNHFSSYITCGEDGSVLSWKGRDAVHSGTDLEQCIMHPCSVWCGVDASYFYSHVEDQRAFGTGGHDGVLRIFSTHAITTESAILQAAFSEEVSEMEKKKHKGPTDEDLKNAPKWENRGSNFGKSDQQVAVFNKDNKLIAAQWEAASQSWIEIGVVTGNSDGGSLPNADGTTSQWNHIMPVEIETPGGVTTLKLGYNDGENPFAVASRFVDQHNLDVGYVQQIADWIISKGGTGSSQAPVLDMQDESSINASAPHAASVAPPAPPFQSRFIPQQYYHQYDDVHPKGNTLVLNKLLAKVLQFNAEVAEAGSDLMNTEGQPLTEEAISSLTSLIAILNDVSHYHSSSIDTMHIKPLLFMCEQWREQRLFPVFDLCRILTLHTNGVAILSASKNSYMLHGLLQKGIDVIQSKQPCFPSVMCALRFFTNCMKVMPFRKVLFHLFHSMGNEQQIAFWKTISSFILEDASSGLTSNTLRTSSINFLLNICAYCKEIAEIETTVTPSLVTTNNTQAVVHALYYGAYVTFLEMFKKENGTMDSIFHASVGVGTIIYHSKSNNSITAGLGKLIPTSDVALVKQLVDNKVRGLLGYRETNTTQYRCLLDLQLLIQ